VSDVATAILSLFHERDGFVSGEEISRERHISRTAVWKHVNALRKLGYVIEAIPSRGYCLKSSPDIITVTRISARLHSSIIGKQIVCLNETISTNNDAFRMAGEGADEGTVVVADKQTNGKGRLGRRWTSPPRVNLYCSVILRPSCSPHEAPQLTFLSAVAVARAIELETALKPQIKWPNDVLINGRKVAGLLNEMSAETDAINFVVLGIGVNLNMTAEQFGDDVRYPAASILTESGKMLDRSAFAATLFNELDKLYAQYVDHGFGPVRDEWQQRCIATGRLIAINDGVTDIAQGSFAGIDVSGALLVREKSGTIRRILSGDVRIL